MAFEAKIIYPLDQNPRKAIGVSLPFNNNAVFGSTYLTKDAIRNNLINFFLTNQRERVFNPTYGAGLEAFIFEQNNEDTTEAIEFRINQIIEENFPSVQANTQVISNPDLNNINVLITYDIIGTDISDQIQIQFNTNGQ